MRRGRRFGRSGFVVALGSALILFLSGVVLANAFGNPWNESNFQRYWYEAQFGTAWRDDMNYIRVNRINPTHMYTVTRGLHDDSDVAVYWEDIGGNAGEAQCISWTGSTESGNMKCLHWHVRMNSQISWTGTSRRHVACHEFGHTLGLHHYPDSNPNPGSCMKEAALGVYSDHDRFHINDYYPNNPNGESLFDFDNLASMVATSDAVIEGDVVQIKPGRSIQESDDFVLQFQNVTIAVDRLYSGKLSGPTSGVTVEEHATVELPLTTEGSHGFFFLHWDDVNARYYIIAPEGRFLETSYGLRAAPGAEFEDGVWVQEIEKLTVGEFRQQLEEAVAEVKQGLVSPLDPWIE
jgi:hypothetical protein